jgi:hypothetical protein
MLSWVGSFLGAGLHRVTPHAVSGACGRTQLVVSYQTKADLSAHVEGERVPLSDLSVCNKG